MEPQFHIGDDLSALERALKELVPTAARLDVAQTMFRAGQAAVGRSSPWRRMWPATTAMFAVVSLALGMLLMIPDQPQIVYVPVDAAPGGARVSPSTMLATGSAPEAEQMEPAGASDEEVEAIASDVTSQSPFGYLRSRALALNDRWDTAPAVSQYAPIPSLRSGDWRALVGDDGGKKSPQPSDSRFPLDWTHLLNIRGS
jgi:hypothetical protein